ncbi:transmembrane ascorbate ferrireductase 1-like [Tasmannia lanceolata]|uniref:transmembrane ascorbate ferrireductase 1-like n=1 Tax=Tasmannia lanceolata TaxID=3420 RepID=UPI004062C5EF
MATQPRDEPTDTTKNSKTSATVVPLGLGVTYKRKPSKSGPMAVVYKPPTLDCSSFVSVMPSVNPDLIFRVFAHMLGLFVAITVILWVISFREGLSLKTQNPQQIFNLHTVLTVIGFIVAGGEAIATCKRISPTKKLQKIVYITLYTISVVTGMVGIFAVFKSQRLLGLPHMFIFHSWIAMVTIALIAVKCLFLVCSFWIPYEKVEITKSFIPWYYGWDFMVLIFAIFTALTGFFVQAAFSNPLSIGEVSFIIMVLLGLCVFPVTILV